MPSLGREIRPDPGRVLRLSLPFRGWCVTHGDMLWLAASAMTATTPQNAVPQPVRAIVQAQATVRIIAGARIRFDGEASADLPAPSDGVVHAEGIPRPARLIEFQ